MVKLTVNLNKLINFFKQNMVVIAIIVLLLLVLFVMKNNVIESQTNSKQFMFILASWCGHCKKLKDSGIIDDVKSAIGENNCIVYEDNEKKAKEYNVKGFPTMGVLKQGKFTEYYGKRNKEDIVKFYNDN